VNPERWQQLKRLFESALEKEPALRTGYLDEACRSDQSLRREVQVLLDSYEGGSFLEKPAYEAVPELFRSEAEDMPPGTLLGTYEISGKIGHGGMGIVYLARDTRLDRPVAIKMLIPRYTSNPHFRERLKREARAAARLSHPGIATVYALEEFGDALYIVYEYVPGHTLLKTIEGGPLPARQLIDTAIQIAGALAEAHERGIVHRDLKPENVSRTDSGAIKILDFGLARFEPGTDLKSSNPRLTHTGVFLGTPAYASPEQLLGGEVDRRTDIFSFGVLLYELATGKHPFGTADSMTTIARILEAEVPELSQSRPGIPKGLDLIVRRCLKKKPSERYESTRELVDDLSKLGTGREPAPDSEPGAALWWWQFHQAVAGFGYYGMLYPIWRVKEWLGGIEGSLFFFPTLIAVGVAANLRLHLWFTSACYVSELSHQRHKVKRWIRWADWLFVCMLASTAVRIHTIHAIIATLLMSVAIGALVAFSLIEPTTTKAALD
jgi:eukaryotic-like serine/threonine-protein kinase